jgi:hypothetical protein
MKLLLHFATFGSVFALFASVIAGTLWVLTQFIQAWGRFFRTFALQWPCPLYPQKRTCAVQLGMSALGQ